MTTETLRRPSVLVLIILIVLSGALNIGSNLILLTYRFVAASSGIPMWIVYLNLVLGVLQIVAAILIIMSKRVGLLLGLVVYIVSIIMMIISIISGQAIMGVIPGIVLAVIGLILLARTLTSDASRSAFA
jgi:hypothetical protein